MLTEKDYCNLELINILQEVGMSIKNVVATSPRGTAKWYSSVTLYEAQKWLREEKKLHITIFSWSQESWQYRITKPHQILENGLYGEDFSSFEEALSEGIKEAVKILKDGNNN